MGETVEPDNKALAGMADTIGNKNNFRRKITCVLVVRQHKKEWLPPLQEALRKKTEPLRTAFGLQDIVVTNKAGAARHKLVKVQQ